MAFSHGSAGKVYVNGRDLSAYLHSATVAATADTAETTCFGASYKSYISGTKDGTISAEGYFESSTGSVDPTLNTALGASTQSLWTVYPQGESAIGSASFHAQAVETSYSASMPVDGVVSVSAEAQSSSSIEAGVCLHVLGAESTGTTNSASYDGSASSTAGASAILHCTAITASSAVVKIQDSADNSSFADIITFTSITTAGSSERVAITGTVRRYVRATVTVTGAGSFTYTVSFSRK